MSTVLYHIKFHKFGRSSTTDKHFAVATASKIIFNRLTHEWLPFAGEAHTEAADEGRNKSN